VRETKWCGWRPDLPDARDHANTAPRRAILPKSVDRRPGCPPVYDQGNLGSCTANAVGAALQFDQIKQGEAAFVPSRLFIYYNERVMEGSVTQDSGAEIRDGVKSVNKLGAPPESLWPYRIGKFAQKPPAKSYTEALKHQSIEYQRVTRTLTQFRGCLAAGFPFVFGFTVYESFESATVEKTGVVPMPKSGDQVLGGHAVLAVGYDDASNRFIVRNSWGASWGQAGYFTMPYDYLMQAGLSSDFWTIRRAE
jgi:C1A family cysteine protease